MDISKRYKGDGGTINAKGRKAIEVWWGCKVATPVLAP
jgi:hypothetical protein